MTAPTVTVYKRGKGKANILSLNASGSRKKEEVKPTRATIGSTHEPRSHRSTLGFNSRNDRFGNKRKVREISDEQAQSIINQHNNEQSNNFNSFKYAESDAHNMDIQFNSDSNLSDEEMDMRAELIAQRLSPEKQNHFVDAPAPKRFRSNSAQEESVNFDQSERDMQLMEFQNKGGTTINDKPTYSDRGETKGRVSNHLGRRSRNRGDHRGNRQEREKMTFISHDDPIVDILQNESEKASFVSHDDPKANLITHDTPKAKKFDEISFDDSEPQEVTVNLLDFAID